MALAVETVVKQLTDSGILVEGKLANFVPPKAQPKDGEALLRELHKQNLLTKFQAQQVAARRAKSLILGNYVILDKIGAGGMGQVFKAEHRRMKRLVAIKTLPAAFTKDAAALARFQREVEAAAKLRHTNIVAADDADEANGLHFLVMEYIDGKDLSAFVRWNGPLSVEQALNFTLQAARGLAFAHQKGIVHRDIKPANLLVDGEGTVKILDMGLARIAPSDDASAQAELTGTGTVMGTVDYMAPEQAVDTKTADARADIYALGCSLFFLLTGKATYGGDTLMKKVLAHREHPIPRLRSFCPEAPEQLEAVFTKMIAKRVVDRYQTMTDVIAALEGCSSSRSHTLVSQSDAGQTIRAQEESVSPGPTLIADPNTRSGGQSPGSSTAKSGKPSEDVNLAEFLHALPTKSPRANKPATRPLVNRPKTLLDDRKKLLMIGGAVLGVLMLLAGVVINMRTTDGDGTLVVTVSEPDADVQVLNDKNRVEVTRKGDKGPITITVVPGRHRLKVRKDGFEVFTDSFEIRSGNTESITAKLVPLAKAAIAIGKPWESPAFQQWVKDVRAMPAEKQVEAVSRKLKELNPGFDGKISDPRDESRPWAVQDGNVVDLRILTDKVADLSPIRALSELRGLDCGARQVAGQPLDLSALNGMKIRRLSCHRRRVDLSTLKGLPLVEFRCNGCGYTDLTPLSGMPLEVLTVSGNWELKSLEPLRGMPLTDLCCDNCQVADLSPLTGMPLKGLVCQVTNVADLSPLKGMPLEWLHCDHTPVKDLLPLASMKLRRLTFTPNPGLKGLQAIREMDSLVEIGTAEDALTSSTEFWKQYDTGKFGNPLAFRMPGFDQWIKDVQAMPAEQQVEAVSRKLKELNPEFDGKLLAPWSPDGSGPPVVEGGHVVELKIVGDKLRDLSPIRALSELKHLECLSRQIRWEPLDLSPLHGMKIRSLNCGGRDPDLSTVKGLSLSSFQCIGGNITDLTPLSGMPLKSLIVSGCWEIKSLEPLKGMPLTGLACDNCQVADLSPLRGMQLTYLVCHVTQVADLSPLKGMPLEELTCERTLVKDFSPLAGMKLKRLTFTPNPELKGLDAIRQMDSLVEIGTQQYKLIPSDLFWKQYAEGAIKPWESPAFQQWVKDVQAMPAEKQVEAVTRKLQEFNPGFVGKLSAPWNESSPAIIENGNVVTVRISGDGVTDLSPIRALSELTQLECWATQDTGEPLDLLPLYGTKIRTLNCFGRYPELSMVKRLQLSGLGCIGGKFADLTPLSGAPLKSLGLSGNWEVKSLEPLKGMPLTALACDNCQVADLSPLRGMSLTNLACYATQVADLSPLKGMPLEELYCHHTPVNDLSPLAGMKLKKLTFTPGPELKGLEAIRQMDSLVEIGIAEGKMIPRNEFWKKYDEGAFKSP